MNISVECLAAIGGAGWTFQIQTCTLTNNVTCNFSSATCDVSGITLDLPVCYAVAWHAIWNATSINDLFVQNAIITSHTSSSAMAWQRHRTDPSACTAAIVLLYDNPASHHNKYCCALLIHMVSRAGANLELECNTLERASEWPGFVKASEWQKQSTIVHFATKKRSMRSVGPMCLAMDGHAQIDPRTCTDPCSWVRRILPGAVMHGIIVKRFLMNSISLFIIQLMWKCLTIWSFSLQCMWSNMCGARRAGSTCDLTHLPVCLKSRVELTTYVARDAKTGKKANNSSKKHCIKLDVNPS